MSSEHVRFALFTAPVGIACRVNDIAVLTTPSVGLSLGLLRR